MICFYCGREQLDRSQAPNGVTNEDAMALGWQRSWDVWVCPFCLKDERFCEA